jgi:hypothetical protein
MAILFILRERRSTVEDAPDNVSHNSPVHLTQLLSIILVYGLGAQPLLKVEEQRRKGRVEEGVRAYIDSTDAERKSIVEAFESAKDELPTRRNTYVDAAKLILADRQRRQQSSIIETQN